MSNRESDGAKERGRVSHFAINWLKIVGWIITLPIIATLGGIAVLLILGWPLFLGLFIEHGVYGLVDPYADAGQPWDTLYWAWLAVLGISLYAGMKTHKERMEWNHE